MIYYVRVHDFSLFFSIAFVAEETKATKQRFGLNLDPSSVTNKHFLDSVDFGNT